MEKRVDDIERPENKNWLHQSFSKVPKSIPYIKLDKILKYGAISMTSFLAIRPKWGVVRCPKTVDFRHFETKTAQNLLNC